MIRIFVETRMFGLSVGVEIVTLAFFVLMQYRSVTDGRTDGHSSSGYTSTCIACYTNALIKIVKIANFYPPQSQKLPSLGVTPFEFRDDPDISDYYQGRSKSFATRPYRRMEMLKTTHYFQYNPY